jgi:release factor glutamine methyltransferase
MNKYIPLTQQYLAENRSLDRVYTFKYKANHFIGLNTVFSPLVFEDAYFFADHILCEPHSHFLEIGCGTGILSILQALNGANVTATDINPDAISNTKINAILHSVEHKVSVCYSDIFESLDYSILFDTIFWNPPFIFSNTMPESILEKSVFDFNYLSIKKFIFSFSQYLKPGGRAFIGFSSTSGNFDYLCTICDSKNLFLNLIAQSVLDGNAYEEEFSLELYELTSTKN